MHPYHHALSSAKRWGGQPEDYIRIHEWFDASKEFHGDFRHRALRHHTEGIFECERVFGSTLLLTNWRRIPVRWVGEQHVQEDLGRIPTLSDWLRCIAPEPWMNRDQRKLRESLEEYREKNLERTGRPDRRAVPAEQDAGVGLGHPGPSLRDGPEAPDGEG